jgi:2-oxoglutarate ferredoxin oxidoreductase subunit alpha
MAKADFVVGIGGENGQGIATPGDIMAKTFARRGLNLFAYNAYQSIIKGGHSFLTIRTSDGPVRTHGDKIDALVTLNQDSMDRHLKLMGPGSAVFFDSDKIKPGQAADGVQLCALPINTISPKTKYANTMALGALAQMLGIEFEALEDSISHQFKKKGDAVIADNVKNARLAFDYAAAHFKPFATPLPKLNKPQCVIRGNDAAGFGGAVAGVKFYCAYPMSPSTGVLMWMASHGRKLGIMVRQVEDEIGVINMAIGAAHSGCRSMCATSGGGFALMTEALGMSAMMEIPVVCINVQRGGPATGIPTKTEQGDLWQILGAGQGDYPRVIVAPTSILDIYNSVPETFNLVDKLQCPGLILTDLLISEGHASVDPDDFNLSPTIDRGELIFPNGEEGSVSPTSGYNDNAYLRYKITDSGISPRAVPGTAGKIHIVSTDDHDEDGTLISDEFTNPHKRRAMHEKRMRKMKDAHKLVPAPKLVGPENAAVTLVGWGSTDGVIREAVEKLAAEEGIVANHLQIRWIVPFHGEEIKKILSKSKKIIMVENNYSGQFYRYMRSETGIEIQNHIRKYDGEPFQPHHIVESVKNQLAGKETLSVPVHEIMV